jgi:dienelactone hydrolase
MAAFLHEYFAEQPTNVPAGSVDFAAARAHSRVGAPVAKRPQVWPVLLYSHALGLSRELAAAQVEDLASHGYVVVSVDHTYEASAVQFPGGRVASRLPEVFARDVRRKLALDTRVADIRFVLDRLTELAHGRNPDAEHRPLPARLRRALDLSRVGMIGYSYGGYTAGEAMYHDRRIDAGINLDGAMEHGWSWEENGPYLPGNVVTRGLDRPFLLFGSEGHNHLRPDLLRSWADFWPNQRGWKRDLTLHGSRHGSFSDLQTLTIDIGRAFDLPPGTLEPIYGTIDPERSIAVQRAYIAAFFDLHLRDRDVRLLAGPSPAYPEVEFVP